MSKKTSQVSNHESFYFQELCEENFSKKLQKRSSPQTTESSKMTLATIKK